MRNTIRKRMILNGSRQSVLPDAPRLPISTDTKQGAVFAIDLDSPLLERLVMGGTRKSILKSYYCLERFGALSSRARWSILAAKDSKSPMGIPSHICTNDVGSRNSAPTPVDRSDTWARYQYTAGAISGAFLLYILGLIVSEWFK